MKKLINKFGTDSRYLYWAGAALDPKFVLGATGLATVLNWAAFGYVHRNLNTGAIVSSEDHVAIQRFVMSLVIFLITTILIRHSDWATRWILRSFACGLPFALNLFLFAQRAVLFN